MEPPNRRWMRLRRGRTSSKKHDDAVTAKVQGEPSQEQGVPIAQLLSLVKFVICLHAAGCLALLLSQHSIHSLSDSVQDLQARCGDVV